MQNGQRYVPRGVAYHDIAGDPAPETIVFVLLPNLSMLAFSAAIEPLRIANQLTGKMLFKWVVASETGAAVRCSNGVDISVDGPLPTLDRKTKLFVCSGLDPEFHATRRIVALVRRHWRMGGIVGGLCTGAYALAKAGVLDNRDFTLHWENQGPFAEIYPDLTAKNQIFAVDGRVMTCGGGTASADLFLHLIAERHGHKLARAVADMCLKRVQRVETDTQKSSLSAEIRSRNPKLLKVLERINTELSADLSLESISDEIGISRRQIERLFKRHMNTSPKQYVLNARLARARELLSETNLSAAEVSAAVGFNSPAYFRSRFRAKFGVGPGKF